MRNSSFSLNHVGSNTTEQYVIGSNFLNKLYNINIVPIYLTLTVITKLSICLNLSMWLIVLTLLYFPVLWRKTAPPLVTAKIASKEASHLESLL